MQQLYLTILAWVHTVNEVCLGDSVMEHPDPRAHHLIPPTRWPLAAHWGTMPAYSQTPQLRFSRAYLQAPLPSLRTLGVCRAYGVFPRTISWLSGRPQIGFTLFNLQVPIDTLKSSSDCTGYKPSDAIDPNPWLFYVLQGFTLVLEGTFIGVNLLVRKQWQLHLIGSVESKLELHS